MRHKRPLSNRLLMAGRRCWVFRPCRKHEQQGCLYAWL